MILFEKLLANVAKMPKFVHFENEEVERICLSNFDKDNDGFISVDEAKKVTNIGVLFNNIKTLKNLDDFRFFNNVEGINNGFVNCSNLIVANVWEGVKYFYDNTFQGASKIEKVIVPSSIINMGRMWVREKLKGEAVIIIYAKTPPVIYNYNIPKVAKVVYVPDESVELYKNNKLMTTYLSDNIQPISKL